MPRKFFSVTNPSVNKIAAAAHSYSITLPLLFLFDEL